MDTLTVAQLNEYIRLAITKQPFFQRVVVYGEISSFKYSGQHAYFVLKDQDGAIQCSCFYAKKTYNPSKDGEACICTGKVDYYGKTGKLSLIVDTIQPVGKGALHIMLEKLKAKLMQEGLFDQAHKKAIPRFCQNVGVVTSKTGAVIRDIVRTVRNKNELIKISVFDVRVQGETASQDIERGLKFMDTLGFDCIILARGGGSFEDLMPFNDESLARTIYAMNTPIISAVGHETDFSISDFVADARAATPTAAAELVAFDVDALRLQIKSSLSLMYSDLLKKQALNEQKVKTLIHSLGDKSLRKFEKAENTTLLLTQKLANKSDNLIREKEQRLLKLIALLEANNPAKLLQNGYFKIAKDGVGVTFDNIEKGDKVDIISLGGTLVAEIIDKKNNDN